MTLSRRTILKLGLGAGATSLLEFIPHGVASGSTTAAEILAPIARTPKLRARPLPLGGVRLLGGPLKRAQDADIKYLLELEPDRMLAFYRQTAGLLPRAKGYDGWDGGGRNLTGHIAGHYLSAVSAMWLATADKRFKDRAVYIVAELKLVQDKHGDGYLSALEGGRKCFAALARGEIKAASFDLNGEWSPWYTLHKTFAGLRDAHRFTGNRTALVVEAKFAGWAEKILSGLGEPQLQHMLETEFGGMNEVLVDLYADTGDERWLRLSYAFEHAAFVEPLKRHEDNLGGTHANTQIPKLIGSAERYIYAGDPADLMAASYFYDRVAHHHSFSSGGHGTDEYFGPPDHLGDRVHGRTSESCNVYNMLKMSRQLFSIAPDAHYADFHERALFNHAMASIDPEDGRMCYMVPVGPGVTHEYQDKLRSFTCCVGTGMENHALAGDGLYFESVDGKTLWVNIYAPSTADWPAQGARLAMDSNFPEGESAKVTLTLKAPKAFTLAVRRPYWAGDDFSVKVNGVAVALPAQESNTDTQYAQPGATIRQPRRKLYTSPVPVSAYVPVKRTWQNGDVVEVTLPKTLRLEPTPDLPNRVSIMWGPLVLAGDLGPEPARGAAIDPEDRLYSTAPSVPVFVAGGLPVSEWVERVPDEAWHFRTKGVGREPDAGGKTHDVDLAPLFRLHKRTYSTYWDVVAPTEWPAMLAAYGREADRQRTLEAATIALVRPANAASEASASYQAGKNVSTQVISGRAGRAGRSWFSYDLAVDAGHPMTLVVTYYSADRRTLPARFELLLDGTRVAEQVVERTDPGVFKDVVYALPAELVAGKPKVTIKFQAMEGSQVAAVFGVRMVRADQLPR